jgi:myosin heavy subunit
LDIFGFELFEENFFEQMCINYTNEKLHKLYISAVFDAEKAELLSEGLDYCLENLVYPENTGREVIQLLSKSSSPVGIFKLVNDAAKLRPSGE